jgi:glycosyltransferase involved in cell wall biosynthesis
MVPSSIGGSEVPLRELQRVADPQSLPLVSVVIPFFNESKYLGAAIESVLLQSYTRWELFLVDDGSSDGSSEIARGYASADPERIYYLVHADGAKLGAGPARNLGLRHAKGELVAFLDGDDVWLPFKLERQVPLLMELPEVDLLYGNTLHSYYPCPSDGAYDYLQDLGVEPGTIIQPPDLLTLMLENESIHPAICSLLVRRDACRRVGWFPEELHSMYEDTGFLASLLLTSVVLVTGECSAVYRMHDESSCNRAIATGEYHLTQPNLARGRYLKWLEQYLRSQEVADQSVLRALEGQLAHYGGCVRD